MMQAKSDVLSSSLTVTQEIGIQELLARCWKTFENGEQHTAICQLEQIFGLAQDEYLTGSVFKAAICLGLMHMERGDPERALYWFDRAQAADGSNLTPWTWIVTALVRIGRAEAKARAVARQLVETQMQVTQQIQLLQAEAKEMIAHLRQEMKIASVPDQVDRLPISQHQISSPIGQRPSLGVQLLGRFEARLANGEALTLCTNRRGQALFKILATQPHVPYHKERLLLLFWPDGDPIITTGKLHIAVSRLRRSLLEAGLGSDALCFEDNCYFLNSELRVQSDVAQFEAHYRAGQRLAAMNEPDLAAAEYEAAYILYQGPYVAEVVGEDWPLTERARLEDQFLMLLTQLASWYFDKGRYSQSSECCRRILEYDDLREDVYRQLMRSLCRQGQRNQALCLYQNCMHILLQELGVQPMRETTELFEQIRQGQVV